MPTQSKLSAIILAAGKGTRMESDLPKCLHQVAGAPMLHHVLKTALGVGIEDITVVTGYGADLLRTEALGFYPDLKFAHQEEQLGTGHAVQIALQSGIDDASTALVLYGDTPLIREDTLLALVARAKDLDGPVILGFEAETPGGYGRLVTQGGTLLAIREAKDATDQELEIKLCNSGVLACPIAMLRDWIAQLSNNNAQGEYYLTDVVEIARAKGHEASFITCDFQETQGVNTIADLEGVNRAFQEMKRVDLARIGVRMSVPESVVFHFDTVVGQGSTIEPYVVFGAGVSLESAVWVKSFSYIEGAHIGSGAQIGPYSRIRPETIIGEDSRVGNFVEIKASSIEEGVKIGHLSYIGDALIGRETNIGAGTITCNYDGVLKHKTEIGAGAFVGSNTALVAPVRIGRGAMTGSGSVITEDVLDDALGIARARQVNKPNFVRKFMAKLREVKKSELKS